MLLQLFRPLNFFADLRAQTFPCNTAVRTSPPTKWKDTDRSPPVQLDYPRICRMAIFPMNQKLSRKTEMQKKKKMIILTYFVVF